MNKRYKHIAVLSTLFFAVFTFSGYVSDANIELTDIEIVHDLKKDRSFQLVDESILLQSSFIQIIASEFQLRQRIFRDSKIHNHNQRILVFILQRDKTTQDYLHLVRSARLPKFGSQKKDSAYLYV